MKELLKIMRLIVQILTKPKKVSYSYTLTKYNMKTMKIFIVFILISTWVLVQFIKRSEVPTLEFILIGMVTIVILFFIMTKITIKLYLSIINSAVEFSIPFKIMEKTLMPYIATYAIVASLFFILTIKHIFLRDFINIVLLIWLNIQVYYAAIYRVKNKEMNRKEKRKILKKLSIIIGVVLFLSISRHSVHINDKGYKFSYENPEIRVEVYNACLEVYNEAQIIMTRGQNISERKKIDLLSKMNRVTYDIESSLRDNESKLTQYIRNMIKANQEWNEAKINNNKKNMEEQLDLFNSYANEAKLLMEMYKEKGDN